MTDANTMVNFVKRASGNEFKSSNPAGVISYLRATNQLKNEGSNRYRWRGCSFFAHVCDETRFLPTAGLVSSLLMVDQISGPQEEVYQLLVKIIEAVEKYNAALVFIPVSRPSAPAKAKPDKLLLEIAAELFSEKLKRSEVESHLNRAVPMFLHRAEGLPLFLQFDDVAEVCDEKQ